MFRILIIISVVVSVLACTSGKQPNESSAPVTQIRSDTAWFTVGEIRDTSKTETVYTFPLLADSDSSAAKINRSLQESELELEVGEEDSSIFEKIWPQQDSFSGITEFGFRVIENSSSIFAIEFIKEGCGAYCEGYSTYYSFDSKTGELVTLNRIFNEDGLKQVAKSIVEERRTLVKEAIESAEPGADGDAMKEMYMQCLEYLTEDNFESGQFYIANGKITFIGSRCSSHAARWLDDVGEFENVKAIGDLSPYLSAYGKKLLSIN